MVCAEQRTDLSKSEQAVVHGLVFDLANSISNLNGLLPGLCVNESAKPVWIDATNGCISPDPIPS